MRKKTSVLLQFLLLIIQHLIVSSTEVRSPMQEKAEASVPVTTTLSPPEGNTTFVGGTTWCVAMPGVSQLDLQKALDWACGAGKTDCSLIQSGGDCFHPDTLLSHASFAFNSYYQQNGNSDIACNFGGTATIIKRDPSYKNCNYAAPGPVSSSLSRSPGSSFIWLELEGFLMLLYLIRS